MSKTLTFEIPDELYEVFEQRAEREGRTTESVALEWLARTVHKPRPKLSDEELKEAWERLARHAGAANSGDPHSADNDRIDEDLAESMAVRTRRIKCCWILQDCFATST